MKRLLVVLLLVALNIGALQANSVLAQRRRYAFINRYASSVAAMYGSDKPYTSPEKLHFGCTMTAIEERDGGYYFMSAAHCIVDAPSGFSFYAGDDDPNGKRYPAVPVAVGDQAKGYDFSVLFVKAPHGTWTLAPLGHDPHQFGEKLYSISFPEGAGKSYIEGVLQIPKFGTRTPGGEDMTAKDGGVEWTGDFGMFLGNEGSGSSGSSIICEDQEAVCGVIIAHIEGSQVAEPIERFETWWKAVQAGKEPRFPAKMTLPTVIVIPMGHIIF